MSTAFYATASYKPQVLSRTEGFHLPSPAPSTPPSADSTPGGASHPNPAHAFDTGNLFISPPSYLSVPETFRKFPGPSPDGASAMDFSDELASLISHPSASSPSSASAHPPPSHERSTHSPAHAYDDYRPHTHNIFDISAPTHHSHHPHHHHHPPHSPYGPAPSAFSLPHPAMHPSSAIHSHALHDFAPHAHFNSTVPAVGSSMRYEPPGPASATEPSSVSSFTSHLSSVSNYSTLTGPSDAFHSHPAAIRQTPSPVSAGGAGAGAGAGSNAQQQEYTHRSRSRSRTGGSSGGADPAHPPSTHGGPARRTRAKRNNSVSSVSPPPLQRHTQPLVIPGTAASAGARGPGPASPLSLHTNGWFIPPASAQQGGGEFSLPTPDSVHGGFSGFTHPLGVSPKDVNGLVLNPVPGGVTTVSMKGESPPGDMATKQAMLANEKRRRRRESHNAVERRRRDNINEKISELATLIPDCLLDPATTTTTTTTSASPSSPSASAPAANPTSVPAPADDAVSPTSPIGGGGAYDPEEECGGKDGSGKEGPGKDSKDKDGAGVKANKGMILRKSVEYIRYLQQLVSAQASRNRDLEQQLQTYRNGGIPSPPPSSSAISNPLLPGHPPHTHDDDASMSGLLLHDEVDLPPLLAAQHASSHGGASRGGRKRSQSSAKKFSGFELESVEEMDMEDDVVAPPASANADAIVNANTNTSLKTFPHPAPLEDEDMERPSTTSMSVSVSLSPRGSPGVVEFEEGDGGEGLGNGNGNGNEIEIENGGTEERGRKVGRRELSAGVKVKEEAGMEMS